VIYFDHNASTPLLPQARAAWLEAEESWPGNPSSPHRIGARAERALQGARERLAAMLGCSPPDLVWTSGATEACNTVLRQAAVSSPTDSTVWVSAIEHPAVLESARRYFPGRVQLIPVDRRGVADVGWIAERLARERPAMVALMAANNETGVLQPWEQVQRACAAVGVPFFCDATQWCGRRKAKALGACDFVAGSGHKFGGPRGMGFLKCPTKGTIYPLMCGGPQEDGRRAGTENVAGAFALVAAFEWCDQQIASGAEARIAAERDEFERELTAKLPAVVVNGAGAERLWNTSSVVMPEADCRQRWVVKLDRAAVAVSTGSACSSGSERPSHVLAAMGLSAGEAGRALRFSAGWQTPAESWGELLAAIVRIHQERATAGIES
jgi:cysteine desulfurase